MTFANASTIRRAFEAAGVELLDENGGGPGARLKGPSNGLTTGAWNPRRLATVPRSAELVTLYIRAQAAEFAKDIGQSAVRARGRLLYTQAVLQEGGCAQEIFALSIWAERRPAGPPIARPEKHRRSSRISGGVGGAARENSAITASGRRPD
jgi:hypothetical protein